MEQTSIEVNTNRDRRRKRLSALAQLVRLLTRDGITTIAAQAAATGYTTRAIELARREVLLHGSEAGFGPAAPEARFGAVPKPASESPKPASEGAPETGFGAAPNPVSEDKKKRSPQTPLKEKLPLLDKPESNLLNSVAARERAAATPKTASPSKGAWQGVDLHQLAERITAACSDALASQAIAPGLASMSTPLGWLEAGADLDRDVIPALVAAGVKHRGRQIRSWDYFSGMVADAKARRMRGLPPPAGLDASSHKPTFSEIFWADVARREREREAVQ